MHEPLYPTDDHPFVDAHGAVRLVSKLEQIVPLMEDSQHAVVCSAVMGLAYSCLVEPFERAKRQVHPPPAVGVHNERLPFSDGAAHKIEILNGKIQGLSERELNIVAQSARGIEVDIRAKLRILDHSKAIFVDSTAEIQFVRHAVAHAAFSIARQQDERGEGTQPFMATVRLWNFPLCEAEKGSDTFSLQ